MEPGGIKFFSYETIAMKLKEHKIKRIAVFRALQLGDLLCSIPALRALHHAYPKARITLLGLPWGQSLPGRFPHYIHSFKHFPGYPGLPEQKLRVSDFTRFLEEMQQQQFDLVLQMQGNGSLVNSMVELIGGKYTAGFYLKDDYRPNEDLFLEYPGGIHEVERHLQLMNYLGIESCGTELEFPLYKRDYEEYEQLHLSLPPQQYVCIHPGSRGAWRQWPAAYFAELANYCAAQGLKIVLTGTKEEMEIIQQVLKKIKTETVIAAGKTSLGAAGVLIKNAFLLISNCTGVSHMAAAFETPSLVISMDGEPERWGPLNKELHRTVDWKSTPHFEQVFVELKDLFSRLQRNHIGNEMIPVAK